MFLLCRKKVLRVFKWLERGKLDLDLRFSKSESSAFMRGVISRKEGVLREARMILSKDRQDQSD